MVWFSLTTASEDDASNDATVCPLCVMVVHEVRNRICRESGVYVLEYHSTLCLLCFVLQALLFLNVENRLCILWSKKVMRYSYVTVRQNMGRSDTLYICQIVRGTDFGRQKDEKSKTDAPVEQPSGEKFLLFLANGSCISNPSSRRRLLSLVYSVCRSGLYRQLSVLCW
jgi:hypothetical protein